MDEQQGSGRGLFFTVYRVLFALLSFGTGLFFTIWGANSSLSAAAPGIC
jgi:quinate dehydrogenase (quinone)